MSEALLDLSTPRVIILHAGDRQYNLTCRRVGPDDWREYFKGLEFTAAREGRDTIHTQDVETPRRILAERVIIDLTGYQTSDSSDIRTRDHWQSRLPLPHRLAVGLALVSVRHEDSEDVLNFEGETVSLSAVWSASEDFKGMQTFSGLKHVFSSPTEAQHRRYAREASRSRVLGGERTGTTVYPGSQLILAELYDELIRSVDGYCIAGVPLPKERIVAEMDMYHKVVAAQQVFQPQGGVIVG